MKKSIISFITAFAVAVSILTMNIAIAQAKVDIVTVPNNCTLEFDTQTGTITDCIGDIKGDLKIPTDIDGVPVVEIGSYAFEYCSEITSVIIPDSVTKIEYNAFLFCDDLKSVDIGNGVKDIDSILFEGCDFLESISIGSGAESINSDVFRGLRGLKEITISPENNFFSTEDGVLFNKDKSVLIAYPTGRAGGYTIPDSVNVIKEKAFYDCSDLTGINIPDSVTKIENDAFHYCDSLKSIDIPDSVDVIEGDAFESCSSLTSVSIGSGVKTIGKNAFRLSNKLMNINTSENNKDYISSDGVLFSKNKSVMLAYPAGRRGEYTIPNGVQTVGENAFAFCYNITNIKIPEGVTAIGENAFSCSDIKNISIPKSLKTIYDNAFYGCCDLNKVYYSGNEEQWNNIKVSENSFYHTDFTRVNDF